MQSCLLVVDDKSVLNCVFNASISGAFMGLDECCHAGELVYGSCVG